MPKVLVACEESQAVTIAFRKLGVEAYSCDLEPCSGGHPEWHFQRDVLPLLALVYGTWELIIAFPPCTHLASSGARWFKEKQKDGRQEAAVKFFMDFVPPRYSRQRVAIENPVGIMSTRFRKPDQIIQPWMYGHPESKATCLWLWGLPELKPTEVLIKTGARWSNQTPSGQNKLGPSEDRAKLRSKTYAGVAKAMAEQWSVVL